jgi:membrane protein implicated in regulation of membrane protease activity
LSGLLDAANSTTLNCIYFSSLVSGLILALASMVLSGIGGDGADGGADFDADGDGAGDLTIFSPVTIGAFLAVFGGVGLITSVGFEMDARLSLVISGFSAALISLLVAVVYSRLLIELHGSTNISETEMVGIEGVVTTPIPATGLGEVQFEIHGERMSRPARSTDNTPIPRGSTVMIEQVLGAGVVTVRPHRLS